MKLTPQDEAVLVTGYIAANLNRIERRIIDKLMRSGYLIGESSRHRSDNPGGLDSFLEGNPFQNRLSYDVAELRKTIESILAAAPVATKNSKAAALRSTADIADNVLWLWEHLDSTKSPSWEFVQRYGVVMAGWPSLGARGYRKQTEQSEIASRPRTRVPRNSQDAEIKEAVRKIVVQNPGISYKQLQREVPGWEASKDTFYRVKKALREPPK